MMWKHTLDFISQVPEFCCLRNWMLWFACHNQDTYWEMYYRVQNTTLWVVWWGYFNVWVNIFERNTPHSYHHRVISELKLKDKSLHLKGLKVRGLLTCQVSLLDFLLHSWDRRKGRGIYIYIRDYFWRVSPVQSEALQNFLNPRGAAFICMSIIFLGNF